MEGLNSDFEEERFFRKLCLGFIHQTPNFTDRSHALGHLTASAWVLDADKTSALLIHHRTLDRWFQPGGHVEPGDASMLAAAQRELAEECGIANAVPLSENLFDLDIHLIPAKGDMPEHAHYDLRFAFVAPPGTVGSADFGEIKGLRWVPLPDLLQMPPQQSLRRMALKTVDVIQG